MIPAPVQNLIDRLSVAWHERALLLKAASFAVVGLFNSAVDFAVFSFGYYYLALPLVAANTLSWFVAVSGSYVLNSKFTFAANPAASSRLRRYLGFSLAPVAGIVANTATIWCLVTYLIPAWAAKVAAIGVSFVVNFSLSHFVVFRQRVPKS